MFYDNYYDRVEKEKLVKSDNIIIRCRYVSFK